MDVTLTTEAEVVEIKDDRICQRLHDHYARSVLRPTGTEPFVLASIALDGADNSIVSSALSDFS